MDQRNARHRLYKICKQFGTWVVLTAFVAVGATSYLMGQVAPKKKPVEQLESSAPGRYQIIFNPNVRADTFLLDTETGKTWVHTTITDVKGHPTIWMNEARMDSDADFLEWSKHQVLNQQPDTGNSK